MPILTNRDRLEILIRNPQFVQDLEYLQSRFNLSEDLPKTKLKRVGQCLEEVCEPTKREIIRARFRAVDIELDAPAASLDPNEPTDPDASLKNIQKLIAQLKSGERRDATLTRAVRVIRYKTVPGNGDNPDIILHLRDEQFLTLEIDLLAANTENLCEEARKAIAGFRSIISKKDRTRKHHKSTLHIDPWAVYDACNGKSMNAIWEFAKEVRRKRTGSVDGFTSESKEYKAARRALKIAQDLMKSLSYPSQ